MDDLLLVALFKPFSNAGDDGPDVLFAHVGTVVDDGHEVSALDEVGEEDESLVVFVEAPVLADMLCSHKLPEDF